MKYFKSTTESQESVRITDNYIVKLERYTQDLALLQAKLNKYTCEPKTKDLFERRNFLKQQMLRLQKSNQEIIRSLRERKELMEDQLERVKTQFDEFMSLQSALQDYVTHNH
tara:strand:+ start:141888 stop:142223 length:336 start_codon:yes stop_codon:yes gene_type:complete